MSLLQADPSRTSTIRDSFERDFARRISRLSRSVKDLLKSKAFGQLTANAFCPTGKGGGVDPTCGKRDLKSAAAEIRGMSDADFERLLKSKSSTVKTKPKVKPEIDNLKVLTGGNGKEGELVTYYTTSKGMAESYVDMYNERFGSGGKLHSKTITIVKAAPWSIVKKLADQLGMDTDSYTPASVFDYNLFEKSQVASLISALKSRGYDGSVLDDIAYGQQIQDKAYITFTGGLTSNTRWAFEESQTKVENFESWLKAKLTEVLEEKDIHSGTDWWQIYIERAYKFGAARAFDQLYKKKANPSEGMLGAKQFFMGSLPKERLKLLIARTYKGIEGLTESMRNQLTQELTDGLLQGLSYNEVGKRISNRLGIGLNRAKTIARTEIVRAQAEGQLAALKSLGVKQLGVEVEFHTAKTPCPKCKKYRGRILTVEEAEGLIPLHPNCKCAFTPFVNPIPSPQKTARKKALEASILKVGKKK